MAKIDTTIVKALVSRIEDEKIKQCLDQIIKAIEELNRRTS